MKKVGYLCCVFSVLLTLVFVSGVLAQEGKPPGEQKRVIEETLVLKDPTVTAAGKWVVGAAGEWWYIKGNYDTYDQAGTKVAEGDIKGGMPGGNIFFGYGDWTLNVAYRKGSFDIDQHYNAGYDVKNDQDQKEFEVTLRYLVRGLATEHITPYLIAGYNQTNLDETKTLSTGWIWTHNGTAVGKWETTFRSPLLGIGAIVPFNEYLGLRADVRGLWSDAKKTRDDGKEWTGSGLGGAATLTGYWNIYQGLNLQVGGKAQYLNGGSDIGWWGKGGVFVMLGYSYKF
jgi:hypothetical protein